MRYDSTQPFSHALHAHHSILYLWQGCWDHVVGTFSSDFSGTHPLTLVVCFSLVRLGMGEIYVSKQSEGIPGIAQYSLYFHDILSKWTFSRNTLQSTTHALSNQNITFSASGQLSTEKFSEVWIPQNSQEVSDCHKSDALLIKTNCCKCRWRCQCCVSLSALAVQNVNKSETNTSQKLHLQLTG